MSSIPATRSILLVTAYFPPSTEVGAARWEGFAPFLCGSGWQLSVMMETPGHGQLKDEERVRRLPPDVQIRQIAKRDPTWRKPVLSGVAVARRLSGASSVPAEGTSMASLSVQPQYGPSEFFNAAIGAARCRRWIRDVVIAGTGAAPPSVVISSGPSHDAHVAASELARRHSAAHVVDLRDPWIANPADSLPSHSAIIWSPTRASIEERVMRRAAAVIANTPSAADALLKRRPFLRGKVHVILNGSDRAAESPRRLGPDDDFLIVHTGTLYLDRDPRPFLQGVANVRAGAHPEVARRVRVVFMGRPALIAGRSLTEWADDFGLQDAFEERAFGTREEASALMRSASLLVAFQGATPTQVPAKIFEYVSYAATLFAVTDPDSATAALLADSRAHVVGMHDIAGIESRVGDSLRRAIAGEQIVPVDAEGRYSRATQAELLLQLLERL